MKCDGQFLAEADERRARMYSSLFLFGQVLVGARRAAELAHMQASLSDRCFVVRLYEKGK